MVPGFPWVWRPSVPGIPLARSKVSSRVIGRHSPVVCDGSFRVEHCMFLVLCRQGSCFPMPSASRDSTCSHRVPNCAIVLEGAPLVLSELGVWRRGYPMLFRSLQIEMAGGKAERASLFYLFLGGWSWSMGIDSPVSCAFFSSIIASSRYGQGKVLVFGHKHFLTNSLSYSTPEESGYSNLRLLKNGLKWLCRNEKEPMVLCHMAGVRSLLQTHLNIRTSTGVNIAGLKTANVAVRSVD